VTTPAEPPGKSSFWASLPGILTGSAALLTAMGGLLALWLNARPARGPKPADPAVGSATTTTPVTTNTDDVACYTPLLSNIPADHQRSVKVGAADFRLVEPEVSKQGVFAVRLMENGRALGLLRLTVDPADGSFVVQDVVDAGCQPVVDVSNPDRGSGRALQNWDQVKMRIAGASYVMRLGYDGGVVEVGHFRKIVE
jgi:hypothetical protein